MDENYPPKTLEPLKPNTGQAQMPQMELSLIRHGQSEPGSNHLNKTQAAAENHEETRRTDGAASEVVKESLDIAFGATTGNISLDNTKGYTNTGSANSGINSKGSGSARISGNTGNIIAKEVQQANSGISRRSE